MPHLEIAPGETIYYEHDQPTSSDKTFVFVNALTGNTGMWQADAIGPVLRAAGHGTLCYNFRGQADTTFADGTPLTPTTIVSDIATLVDTLRPQGPILVGLSIGGLFAAQAHLAGTRGIGLVLINTLRKPTQRLAWISNAMVELAKTGGGRLLMMANMPVIASPELIEKSWDTSFTGEPFEAMDPKDGLFRLMQGSLETDWDFAYESLDVPVLLMTGMYDRLFRIGADVAELKARIRDAHEVVLEDAGHLIPAEKPERFTAELLAFADTL
ncbi:MAG: alpha/beta hydrolase [Rhodospirillaceae bacterium]|jgi:3-oxoadipate enol-lactonase|nr:alpha/beta hydrolase [Rhodospirillaceae bacterium]MBT6137898.1 alpha/beta hydrolase [Rhodospirillaceae bacterium]